jgi:hypothetical protein
MKKTLVALLMTMFAALIADSAFAQGGNGTLTGTVEDTAQALIPGVSITATNNATGVQSTTVSNESGAYNISSLLPGTYRLTATLPGFQTQNFNNIDLGTNETKRFNFRLQVASVTTNVEVSVDAAALLTTQGANVGEVLQAAKVQDLPLVSGDVLDLVRIMPGVRTTPAGGTFDSFAGLSTSTVNTVRDGLSVTDGRYANGIYGSTTINPDLVGEIRLILTPVDAELGRGNGQVQITTRSGTNRYSGTAVWNVRNTALNANTWDNNNDVDPVTGRWSPTPLDWFNENQVTLSYGGPIVRNKTFFFAQFDKQFRNERIIVTGLAMTNTAKQGIFRYWDGWNNADAEEDIPANTGSTIASIDITGNPRAPFRNQGTAGYNAWIAAGGNPADPYAVSTYTGSLRCVSVFGNVKADGSAFTAADCPGGQIVLPASSGPWDPMRPVMDPTGFIRKFLDFMPAANYFGAQDGTDGDGLNTAGVRWMRGNNAAQSGFGGVTLQTGQNINADRDQFNIKIDQVFTPNHKLSAGYTYEVSGGATAVGFWPEQYTGETKRRPHVLTTNYTATLSPTLLNEARFGIRITQTDSLAAYENSIKEIRDGAREFLLTGGSSLYTSESTPFDVLFDPGLGLFRWSGDNAPFETGFGALGNFNPLYNFADTVRWTRGAHALRLGGELRLTRSNGFNFLPRPIPLLQGGAGNLPGSQTGIFASTETGGLPGLTTGMRDDARELMYFMAGSLGSGNQGYWINSPDDVDNAKWEDYITAERKYRDQRNVEYAAFFQDDWKITRNLTLNLGLRYEYYGVPYLKGGFTSTSVGLGHGLFGVGRANGDVFDNWLQPGSVFLAGYGGTPAGTTTATALRCASGVQQSPNLPTSSCDPSKLTTLEFVGPDTPNPDKGVQHPDRNNFGPAVGFAWQVPWFGEGKTTVRGGYSITYGGASANGIALDGILGGAPGATHTANLDLNQYTGEYLDLTDVQRLVPFTPSLTPGGTFSAYGRSGSFTAYNPDWETPYSQNFNLSVTRNLTQKITLDVRYVGTKGNKLSGNLNLNEVNVFNNPELFEALEVVRSGGEAPLFDQMLAGLNLNVGVSGAPGTGTYAAVGTVNSAGIRQTGSMHLRRWQRANLANGNYEAIAQALNGNGPAGNIGLQSLPAGLGTVGGRLLRNGCDRVANGLRTVQTPSGSLGVRCFPENYITMNPQFSTAAGGAFDSGPFYVHNNGYSNYHSLQSQVTVRPTFGLSFTGTYTWSRLMELPSSGHTDVRDRAADYRLGTNHLTHDLRFNGTFELPIGPNKLFFGNTSGWVARVLERWQASFIFNGFSGRPVSITGQQTLWGGSNPDVVGPWNLRSGETHWGRRVSATEVGGFFFGDPNNPSPFTAITDPQCAPGGPLDRTDAMGTNLTADTTSYCTLQALTDAGTGQILLQNAKPGKRGTLGSNTFQTRGVWTLDGNVSKTFQISESKSVQIRVDATNMLNHPIPNDPTLNINSNEPFGNQNGKSQFQGARAFRGTVRVSF